MNNKQYFPENWKLRLKDFQPDTETSDIRYDCDTEIVEVEPEMFPCPNLIFFMLHGLCDFPLGDPGDKTRWVIPFTYKGVRCAISDGKWGVCLDISKEQERNFEANELLNILSRTIKIVERAELTEFSKAQIDSANIAIINCFTDLRRMYYYFRLQAEKLYEEAESSKDLAVFNLKLTSAYNALAMINAYFSWLEHFLVLALAFSSYDREADNLRKFLDKNWTDKFKRILNIEEPKCQVFYNQLKNIKEKYRNTYSHGGFENKGVSFLFHLDGYGFVPGSMSSFRDSVHFGYSPITLEKFNLVCSLFDDFDEWLKAESLSKAWKFAESGLYLRFDKLGLEQIKASLESDQTFEEWLKKEQYYAAMHAEGL